MSPWCDLCGWLGVKNQWSIYLPTSTTAVCVTCAYFSCPQSLLRMHLSCGSHCDVCLFLLSSVTFTSAALLWQSLWRLLISPVLIHFYVCRSPVAVIVAFLYLSCLQSLLSLYLPCIALIMTLAVDWALKTNYLPIYLLQWSQSVWRLYLSCPQSLLRLYLACGSHCDVCVFLVFSHF